ncbi:MAG TPA: SDR family oxidoreductase [Thermoanaerobaculia bacterium]|nr:SDR family oxidoreductase [Thermoanaerobaculia bacterium]
MADERTVLITGVTRGLGMALAIRLAAFGHRVLGCGRSAEVIDTLRETIGEPHDFAVVDITSATEVDAWARRLLAAGQVPDLVLNNAGLINANAPLWEVPAEEFSRVVDVNLKGTFHVIRSFVPAMAERGAGVIVNFSSGWGRTASPEVAPYVATKWGIEGMTRALSQELPRGLSTVAVNPGVIHTDMLESCFGRSAASYPGPDWWAQRAVPFLLSLGPEDNGRSLNIPGL